MRDQEDLHLIDATTPERHRSSPAVKHDLKSVGTIGVPQFHRHMRARHRERRELRRHLSRESIRSGTAQLADARCESAQLAAQGDAILIEC